MKKLVIMLALGLVITGTSFAQNTPDRPNPSDKSFSPEKDGKRERNKFRRDRDGRSRISLEERAAKHTEMLSQKLDLSKSQKKKLQALNLKQAQELESLHGQFVQGRVWNNKQREQRQQIQANWDKDFKHIVGKKQYAKYEAERKQMQANRGKRFGKDDNNAQFRRPANG
ncbi:hypothetical protein [Adhaeribacter radiodurans]|uniref:DUF4890 domain-containing protein n=1 Tax=Adhaeribacter radiodurans TaxID=2745197 RepID=A0A7L7L5V6_9BACT|nr:hypothetical protein [Adhaeribacter radiodurans]QMU28206.1 hypothetical protein HUW48_09210 [Adhaeribacter radiodurans]